MLRIAYLYAKLRRARVDGTLSRLLKNRSRGTIWSADRVHGGQVGELTRFCGYFTVWGTGVSDATHQTQVRAGVSPAAD